MTSDGKQRRTKLDMVTSVVELDASHYHQTDDDIYHQINCFPTLATSIDIEVFVYKFTAMTATRLLKTLASAWIIGNSIQAFSPSATLHIRKNQFQHPSPRNEVPSSLISRFSSRSSGEILTVQILMSDTGGGHRASANALRDAFDALYPGKFECDIVDIYTEYGPFWPFNGYVEGYKLMAKYSFLWDFFYRFGETEFGLWLNDILLTTFCFDPFTRCLDRPSGSTGKRADMVVSVHPLCQDLPLKILSRLDSEGASMEPSARITPFVTVVTDLGGAHKTWFNPK